MSYVGVRWLYDPWLREFSQFCHSTIPSIALENFTLPRVPTAHRPPLGSGTVPVVKVILSISWKPSCSVGGCPPSHSWQIIHPPFETFSAWKFAFSYSNCVLCVAVWIITKFSLRGIASAPRITIVPVYLLEQLTIMYSYSHKGSSST